MKTNDYSWISEVHLITDPEFAEQYMALISSAIAAMTAMNVLKEILGQLIRDYPEDKIVHLSDLDGDDEEEV